MKNPTVLMQITGLMGMTFYDIETGKKLNYHKSRVCTEIIQEKLDSGIYVVDMYNMVIYDTKQKRNVYKFSLEYDGCEFDYEVQDL